MRGVPSEVVHGVVAPAMLAGAACVIARRPWRADVDRLRAAPWGWGAWGPAAGLALGVGACFHGMRGGWTNPGAIRLRPVDASEWLPWIALAAAAAGMVIRGASKPEEPALISRARGWPAGLARLLVSGAVVSVVLWWKFRVSWSAPVGAAWLGLGAVLAASFWRAMEALLTSARIGVGVFLAGSAAAVCAAGIGLTGSASLAQVVGAIAVGLGACFALLAWRRCGAPGAAAAAVAALVMSAAAALGMTQARLPAASAVGVWLAVAGAAIAMALTRGSRGVARRIALPIAAGMLPLLAALGAAIAAFEPRDEYAY